MKSTWPASVLLTVMDETGKAIRSLTGPAVRGLSRVAWDLRLPAHQLASGRPPTDEEEIFGGGPTGPYVTPGKYSVTLSQRVGGVVTPLAGPVSFGVMMDGAGALTLADHQARGRFQAQVQELRRQMTSN